MSGAMSDEKTALFTTAGIREGARLCLPLLPGVIAFAAGFGAVAAKTGLSLGETVAMSAFVYAGASQIAGLAAWQADWTPSAIAAAVLLVATVNARLLLMGASLRPWFVGLPPTQAYGLLALNTDASWIMTLKVEATTGRRDIGVYFGVALLLWAVWVAATPPGWWLGAAIADPRAYALDLVMVVFFAAMLVPLWRGPRKAVPWLVAAGTAILVQALVPGHLYVLAGAVAGALAGAFLDD
jgi:predicted branched-subunit amino acid permease